MNHSRVHGNSDRSLRKYFASGGQKLRSARPSLRHLAHLARAPDAALVRELAVSGLEELEGIIVRTAEVLLAVLALVSDPRLAASARRALVCPVEASVLAPRAHADVHVARPLLLSVEVALLARGVAIHAVPALTITPSSLDHYCVACPP